MKDESKTLKVYLYLLSRISIPHPDEWSKAVVAAISEDAARELANQESGSEGYVWNDSSQVEAKLLGEAYEEVDGVISFSKE